MTDETDVPHVPVEEGHRALQMLREAYDAVVSSGGTLECIEGTWYRIVEEAEAAQRRVLEENAAA